MSLSPEANLGPRHGANRGERRIPGTFPKTTETVPNLTRVPLSLTKARSRGDGKPLCLSSPYALQEAAAEALHEEATSPTPLIVQNWRVQKQRAPPDSSAVIGTGSGTAGSRCQTMPPESWAKYPSHGRDETPPGPCREESALTLPASFSDKVQCLFVGERDTRSESSEHEPIPLPKRLERAMRTGLGRLLPSRRTLRHDTASPSSHDNPTQGRKFISYNEVSRMPDETKHENPPVESPRPVGLQYCGQPLDQGLYEVSAAGDSMFPSMSHASTCRKAEARSTEPDLFAKTYDVSGSQAVENIQQVVSSPLSRFKLDGTVDTISRALENRESSDHGTGTALRRWKSTEGHSSRNRRTSNRAYRSTIQALMTGGSLILHDGSQRRNSGEILVLH